MQHQDSPVRGTLTGDCAERPGRWRAQLPSCRLAGPLCTPGTAAPAVQARCRGGAQGLSHPLWARSRHHPSPAQLVQSGAVPAVRQCTRPLPMQQASAQHVPWGARSVEGCMARRTAGNCRRHARCPAGDALDLEAHPGAQALGAQRARRASALARAHDGQGLGAGCGVQVLSVQVLERTLSLHMLDHSAAVTSRRSLPVS